MNDRYIMQRAVGEGATGGVYEVYDSQMARYVALRQIQEDASLVEAERARRRSEFKILISELIKVQHPNLPYVFDAGIDGETPFMCCSFINGAWMMDELAVSPTLSTTDVARIAEDVLSVLAGLHDVGIVHGMLSPKSLMFQPCPSGGNRYFVVDAGVAEVYTLFHSPQAYRENLLDPALAAPELAHGCVATPLSDLYACGHLLYSLLAGGHPCAGMSLEQAERWNHETGMLPISHYRPEVQPSFAHWLSRLMEPNLALRFESAQLALSTMPAVEANAPVIGFEKVTISETSVRGRLGQLLKKLVPSS